MRDRVIETLTKMYGPPLIIGQDYRWSVDAPDPHGRWSPPVNVAVDSYRTPGIAKVWVIDPRKSGAGQGVRMIRVESEADLQAMARDLAADLPPCA